MNEQVYTRYAALYGGSDVSPAMGSLGAHSGGCSCPPYKTGCNCAQLGDLSLPGSSAVPGGCIDSAGYHAGWAATANGPCAGSDQPPGLPALPSGQGAPALPGYVTQAQYDAQKSADRRALYIAAAITGGVGAAVGALASFFLGRARRSNPSRRRRRRR